MAPAPGAEALGALVAAWTGDHPDGEHRIETGRIWRARQKIAAALSDAATPILVTGPSGHGKTLLLRSFWRRPPKGFAPILAPCAGVEPDPGAIAARILAATRTVPSSDPAAGFVRMLRTQSLRGARPVLLIDDVHAASPATIAALVALAASSRVEVRWVAAGVDGPDLDAVRGVLPGPPCIVAIDNRFSREDVQRLLRPVADALPEAAAAIDVDAVLRDSDGNPRRVLASLAAQLRSFELPRVEIESAMAPPEPARSSLDHRASSEPAPRPVRAAPLRAAPPRARRHGPRRPPTRALRSVFGAVAACAALVWLFDRGPSLAAGSLAVVGRLAVVSASSVDGAWRRVEASAARAVQRATASATDVARLASTTASDLARTARDWTAGAARQVREWQPPVLGEPSEPAATEIAAAEPVIPVGVNSDPWSDVEIDGAAVGSTPLTIELLPGPHRFRAAMADGRVLEKDFVVGEGRNQVVFD